MPTSYFSNAIGTGNFDAMWQAIGIWIWPLLAWVLFWKGWALWQAARRDSKSWFIIILILNTLGLLEISYIFFLGKEKKENS